MRAKPLVLRRVVRVAVVAGTALILGSVVSPAVAAGPTTECTLYAKNSPTTQGTPAVFRFFMAARLAEDVPPSPSGLVTLFDGDTPIQSKPVFPNWTKDNTEVWFSTTVLSVGSHTIRAVFLPSPSSTPCPSTPNTVTHKVNPAVITAPTHTVVTQSASTTSYGQNLSLHAAVTRSGGGAVAGYVDFYVDGAGQRVSVDSSGHASTATNNLFVGSHPIDAVFWSTNINALNSRGSTITHDVVRGPTTTHLSASRSTSYGGTPVTFTASVSNATNRTTSGEVQFKDNGNNLGAPKQLQAGTADITVSDLGLGNHTITANFTSDNLTGADAVDRGQWGDSSASVNELINPPPHDNIADAGTLTGVPVYSTNVYATTEPYEQNHAKTPHASVWWRYTPAQDGALTVTTAGSQFDTMVAVQRGTEIWGDVLGANDDVSSGDRTSLVTVPVVGGQVYSIAVDGYGGATGRYYIHATLEPPTLATKPTITAADPGDTSVRVSWTAPSSMGNQTFTKWEVVQDDGTPACVSTYLDTRSCTVTGLTNGTAYTFKVRAVTRDPGAWSDPSGVAVPWIQPTAPPKPTIQAGDGQATLTWDPPSTMGDQPFSKWEVETADGITVCTLTAVSPRTCSASGIPNGLAIRARVRAVTSAPGTWSDLSNTATTASNVVFPSAPPAPTVSLGEGQATISWGEPSSMGNQTFTTWEVMQSDGSVACTSNALATQSCVVSNLTGGTDYAFKVRAVVAAGDGPFSPLSSSAGIVAPTAPPKPTATAGDGQATLSWGEPSSMGNQKFTKWEIATPDGQVVCTVTLRTEQDCTVTGIPNGISVAGMVRAVTSVPGAWSPVSDAVTTTAGGSKLPSAPPAPTVAPGDGQVTVSWGEPSSMGNQTFTKWEVVTADGSAACSSTVLATRTCTAAGLTNGTAYRFAVRAVTSAPGPYGTFSAAAIPAVAPASGSRSFAYTGDEQTFNVPDGVTSIDVTAVGGPGAPGAWTSVYGKGARVAGSINVTPGSTIYVEVGRAGYRSEAGFNGGGAGGLSANCDTNGAAGGGASDVRTKTRTAADSEASRLLIAAGGGGGGGGTSTPNAGGAGGDAGQAGSVGNHIGASTGGAGGAAGGAASGSGDVGTGGTCTAGGGAGGGGGLKGGAAGQPGTGTSSSDAGAGGGGGGGTNLVPSGGSAAIDSSGVPKITFAWTQSAPVLATAPPAPDAVAGDGQAVISWDQPETMGNRAFTRWEVVQADGSPACTSTELATRTCTASGLTNGTSYAFKVRAVTSDAGDYSKLSAAVIPSAVAEPSGPQALGVTPRDGAVELKWDEPESMGNQTFTKWEAVQSDGSAACESTDVATRSCTATGLTNGTPYTFKVRADTSAGVGDWSDPSVEVMPGTSSGGTVPGQPSAPTATAGNGSVALRWNPPTNMGSQPFDEWEVVKADGSAACTSEDVADTECTASGLTNGTSYQFKVRAVAGDAGQFSSLSKPVAPDGKAPTAAMTAPTAVWELGSTTTLKWTGADAGGSGVVRFDLRSKRAPYTGTFAAWEYPTKWQSIPGATRSMAVAVAPGNTYCYSVRAYDRVGNKSPWSAEKCTRSPLDDRSLSGTVAWTGKSLSAAYKGTILTTTVGGATLSRPYSTAKRVALIATKCPTCGTVSVKLGSKSLGSVNLYAATTRYQQVIALPLVALQSRAKIVIEVTSTHKTVAIDGLGVSLM